MMRSTRDRMSVRPVSSLGLAGFLCLALCACSPVGVQTTRPAPSNLQRAKIFMAAADYRRAIEACQEEIAERPSASSYVYLTYVHQALDAYIESLAKADRWVQVEQLARSLLPGRPEELIDSPDVLARMAKELIQDAVRRQADVAAAMAGRLDEAAVTALWSQQKRWREIRPDGWWFGVPPEWGW